ncbi:uncharacterized protein V1510DRAFT_402450 [Dipodascopsis tothii]|uniref:uncharacterized protein n=1 Tax=Dipodascopsis tothii TaxID=44089 RepID=UPI0034CFACBF
MFVAESPYGYRPQLGFAVAALVLFAVAGCLHLIQAQRYRYRSFGAAMSLACALETMAYAARIQASVRPASVPAYAIETVCTLVAGTVVLVALGLVAGHAVVVYGVRYSHLRAQTLPRLLAALTPLLAIEVAVGGGLAAVVFGRSPGLARALEPPAVTAGRLVAAQALATNAGIVFFLAGWAVECHFRVRADAAVNPAGWATRAAELFESWFDWAHDGGTSVADLTETTDALAAISVSALTARTLVAAAAAAALTMARALYQLASLLQAWGGDLTSEVFEMTLEALVVAVAVWLVLFWPPGAVFGDIDFGLAERTVRREPAAG